MAVEPAIANLLERFKEGAALVRAAAGDLSGKLDAPPAPGKWTARQILCHLADSEMVGRDRMARIAAEDNPTIVAYDQDAWATQLDYAVRDANEALESFCATRAANLRMLQALPATAWSKVGTHSFMGVLTLADMVRVYADHAEGHARQLRTALEA